MITSQDIEGPWRGVCLEGQLWRTFESRGLACELTRGSISWQMPWAPQTPQPDTAHCSSPPGPTEAARQVIMSQDMEGP